MEEEEEAGSSHLMTSAGGEARRGLPLSPPNAPTKQAPGVEGSTSVSFSFEPNNSNLILFPWKQSPRSTIQLMANKSSAFFRVEPPNRISPVSLEIQAQGSQTAAQNPPNLQV